MPKFYIRCSIPCITCKISSLKSTLQGEEGKTVIIDAWFPLLPFTPSCFPPSPIPPSPLSP